MMFVEVLDVGEVSLFLPIQCVGVACVSRSLAVLVDHWTRFERSVSCNAVVVVVYTELCLQVKSVNDVECQSRISEYLRVV